MKVLGYSKYAKENCITTLKIVIKPALEGVKFPCEVKAGKKNHRDERILTFDNGVQLNSRYFNVAPNEELFI